MESEQLKASKAPEFFEIDDECNLPEFAKRCGGTAAYSRADFLRALNSPNDQAKLRGRAAELPNLPIV